MKRRYQEARRSGGMVARSGGSAKRGGWPRVLRETKRSPWTRARGRSCGASAGSTFAIAVSTDEPGAPTFLRGSAGRSRPPRAPPPEPPRSGPSSSIRPSTALARTRVRPCSRPSASRRRWWPAGSSSARRTTKTSAPSTSTLCARTSSAKGSRVPPEARSKRAWCQWQVNRPFSTVPRWRGKPICGQRSSTANASPVGPKHADRLGADFAGQAALCLQLVDRADPGPLRLLHTLDHRAAPFARQDLSPSRGGRKDGVTAQVESPQRRLDELDLVRVVAGLGRRGQLSRGAPATRTSATGRAPAYIARARPRAGPVLPPGPAPER